jgi:hypothetical protein
MDNESPPHMWSRYRYNNTKGASRVNFPSWDFPWLRYNGKEGDLFEDPEEIGLTDSSPPWDRHFLLVAE